MKIADVLRRWMTVDRGLAGYLGFRSLAILFALVAAAILTWRLASNPVLLHTNILAKTSDQSCGTDLEEWKGITVLNPFRSRVPERTADIFLRAASRAECSPGLSEELCRFVTESPPLPAAEWRLVYRSEWHSSRNIKLFYRLRGLSQEITSRYSGCASAYVDLARSGDTWKISGYGVTYGPYNGK